LNSLAEENFRSILRVLVNVDAAEDDPEDNDVEEEQAPKKVAPRTTKRPRARVSGSETGASDEASAKKAKIKPPPLDSKKAERDHLRMLSTTGRGSRPLIPGATFPKNFGDPTDLTSTPKAYATKFINKLTEAEKWDLEQDLLNAMLNNAWGKADAESSEIQNFKKGIGQFCDQLLVRRKEQQVLHYELHKNIALQHRVILNQADKIHAAKEKNAELEKKLVEAQGASSSLATASSELENLRSSYKDLETKLMEAEQKREHAEKQLAEKNSELIKKEGEFAMKRKVDSDTLQKLQKENNGLRKYMDNAEKAWDLLNADVMEPLGYDEERCNQFPRDDLIQLAGDDAKI
ncbi:hypothetical protein QYE76_017409, partial [Lolium multiflorum]